MLIANVIHQWYEQNETNILERAPPTIGELLSLCGQHSIPMPVKCSGMIYTNNGKD